MVPITQWDPGDLQYVQEHLVDVMQQARILDQQTGKWIQFDPNRLAPTLQWPLLDHIQAAERNPDGFKYWYLVVASRQSGKSRVTASALSTLTSLTPGAYTVTMADTVERARSLFHDAEMFRTSLPDDVRADTATAREMNQATYIQGNGIYGRYRCLSAQQGFAGIGRSIDNLHMSELPFWPNLAQAWTILYPAFINRKNATIIAESTPAPMSEPSTEAFKNMATDARLERGRWKFLFMPYFQSTLNERTWNPAWTPTQEERRFVEHFGPYSEEWAEALVNWGLSTGGAHDPLYASGVPWLTYLNLAFRREVMDMDEQIRRYPNLFDVFYPKDPVSCWVQPGATAIPSHAIDAHLGRVVIPWSPPDGWYQEYEPPEEGAVYILACDPAGYAAGDNASFQIIKVWGGGEEAFEQVAEFATSFATPPQVAWYIAKQAERYNHAYVMCEKTGEGMGVTTLLDLAAGRQGTELPRPDGELERVHVRNLHYHKLSTGEVVPGVPAGAELNAKAMARTIDLLLKDGTRIRSQELLMQIVSYRRDRDIREKENWRILNPLVQMPGRRGKHHWDRVSAFMLACYAVAFVPVRFKPRTAGELPVKDPSQEPRPSETMNGWEEVKKKQEKDRARRARRSKLASRRRR